MYYVSENVLSIKCYPNNPIKCTFNIKTISKQKSTKTLLIYYTKTLSQKQITKIVFNKNKNILPNFLVPEKIGTFKHYRLKSRNELN